MIELQPKPKDGDPGNWSTWNRYYDDGEIACLNLESAMTNGEGVAQVKIIECLGRAWGEAVHYRVELLELVRRPGYADMPPGSRLCMYQTYLRPKTDWKDLSKKAASNRSLLPAREAAKENLKLVKLHGSWL